MENYFNQDTLDWLQMRLGRFTASEIHKLFVGGRKKGELFGQGALSYIRTKAAELLTMEVKDDIDFKQAEWGKANEMDAMREFQTLIGIEGDYYGATNPRFFTYGDYAGCSPDWEVLAPVFEGEEDMNQGADFKCPFNSAEHVKNLLLSGVDDFKEERWEYFCQGQMSMKVRGWKKFHFVSYDPRMVEHKYRLKVITMYPDSEWVKEFDQRLVAAIGEMIAMVSEVSGVRRVLEQAVIAEDANALKI